MPDHPLLIFFGHHRCGTTWLWGIMAELAQHLGRKFAVTPRQDDDAAVTLAADGVEVMALTNARHEATEGLPPFRGFHVVRDPRDVVVSGYFSHRYSHPTSGWENLSSYRDQLAQLPVEEGLLREIEWNQRTFNNMRHWTYGRGDVLDLRFEDLIADPYGGLLRVVDFLGVLEEHATNGFRTAMATFAGQLTATVNRRTRHRVRAVRRSRVMPQEVLALAFSHRFAALAGRTQGDEDVTHHFRKGVAGDWANHFDDRHVAAFKERYNDLLLTLGYESDADWDIRCD